MQKVRWELPECYRSARLRDKNRNWLLHKKTDDSNNMDWYTTRGYPRLGKKKGFMLLRVWWLLGGEEAANHKTRRWEIILYIYVFSFCIILVSYFILGPNKIWLLGLQLRFIMFRFWGKTTGAFPNSWGHNGTGFETDTCINNTGHNKYIKNKYEHAQ